MEIDIFTLCDFAQDIGGKLTIVGTFDTIWTHELPAFHPMCSIATRIRFNKDEAGQHSFTLSILDSNDKEIIPPISGDMDIKIPNGEERRPASIIISIGRLTLHSYGKYFVNLSLDDEQIKSSTFVVKKTCKEA